MYGQMSEPAVVSHDKTFAQVEDTRRHKCKACDRTFSKVSNMKLHVLTHTGEKNHKCKACDKTFSLADSLKTHVLTHTVEKNHKCK